MGEIKTEVGGKSGTERNRREERELGKRREMDEGVIEKEREQREGKTGT